MKYGLTGMYIISTSVRENLNTEERETDYCHLISLCFIPHYLKWIVYKIVSISIKGEVFDSFSIAILNLQRKLKAISRLIFPSKTNNVTLAKPNVALFI